jgi:hypothetical protein
LHCTSSPTKSIVNIKDVIKLASNAFHTIFFVFDAAFNFSISSRGSLRALLLAWIIVYISDVVVFVKDLLIILIIASHIVHGVMELISRCCVIKGAIVLL